MSEKDPCNQQPESVHVTRADIVRALAELGIRPGDIVLIHSSLKSLGYVVGGPLAVIDGAKAAVTDQGTVVFPTLVQRDFAHAYDTWDVRRSPSDVGLISETFRLLPDSLRSNQATHSVAAWGNQAAELTGEHADYGPRMGPFGDYCFAWSSPWQKMFMAGAWIVLLGVGTAVNTFKHLAEYCLMEERVQSIRDIRRRCQAMAKIRRFQVPGVWPFHGSELTDPILEQAGLFRYAACGQAKLTAFKADTYVATVLDHFRRQPERFFHKDMLDWLHDYVDGETPDRPER
jgi:aminoglycoside 3-N-acetyltransferase